MRWLVVIVVLAGCDRVFGLGDPYEDARPSDVAIDMPRPQADAPADALDDAPEMIPQPLVHYRFDNSYAEAGTGMPATCTNSGGGGCAFVAGVYGEALQLDGSSIGQVTLPSLPPVFTVMVWAKGSGVVYDLQQLLTQSPDVWWLDMSNGITFKSRSGSTVQTSSVSRPVETWTNIAVTYDGVDQQLYVDTSLNVVTPVGAISYGGNRVVCIGCRMGSSTTYLSGAIDDFYVFDTALTQAEIAAYANTAH